MAASRDTSVISSHSANHAAGERRKTMSRKEKNSHQVRIISQMVDQVTNTLTTTSKVIHKVNSETIGRDAHRELGQLLKQVREKLTELQDMGIQMKKLVRDHVAGQDAVPDHSIVSCATAGQNSAAAAARTIPNSKPRLSEENSETESGLMHRPFLPPQSLDRVTDQADEQPVASAEVVLVADEDRVAEMMTKTMVDQMLEMGITHLCLPQSQIPAGLNLNSLVNEPLPNEDLILFSSPSFVSPEKSGNHLMDLTSSTNGHVCTPVVAAAAAAVPDQRRVTVADNICFQYIRGACQKGDTCRFYHPVGHTPEEIVAMIPFCRDFQV
jgi:hypothetical protein